MDLRMTKTEMEDDTDTTKKADPEINGVIWGVTIETCSYKY